MATAARTVVGVQANALWRTAQLGGLVLTVALISGLWLYPDPSLRVLWYAVVPLLPAVFLVHPTLWRNVCPLATLNLLPGRRSLGLQLSRRTAQYATLVGFALLLGLVPARRFVFNMDGQVLAVVIIAVALLALVLGFIYDRKAGFCNSICPVLPVEKLYGQDPLVRVPNAHCASCSLCTVRGCVDLAPHKAAAQTVRLSPTPNDRAPWFLTPYGAFAAAFPGFVVAYYLVPNTTPAEAGTVYLKVALGMAISYANVVVIASLLRSTTRRTLLVLGAVTLLLYYWFGASSIAAEWQLGSTVVVTIRALAVLLVGYWIVRRMLRDQTSRTAGVGPAA